MIIKQQIPDNYLEEEVKEAIEYIERIVNKIGESEVMYNKEEMILVIQVPDFTSPNIVFGLGMTFGMRLLNNTIME